jgi:hypothetical protein
MLGEVLRGISDLEETGTSIEDLSGRRKVSLGEPTGVVGRASGALHGRSEAYQWVEGWPYLQYKEVGVVCLVIERPTRCRVAITNSSA